MAVGGTANHLMQLNVLGLLAMKIFVTADTHFLHGNIIAYCGRPFTSETMTDELVDRWNAVVGKDDLVIHFRFG